MVKRRQQHCSLATMAQLARGGEQYNLGPIVVIPAYSVITVVMVKQRVGQLVIIIIIILDT